MGLLILNVNFYIIKKPLLGGTDHPLKYGYMGKD